MKKKLHKLKPRPRPTGFTEVIYPTVVVTEADLAADRERLARLPISTKEKFYQAKGMLRAGRPVRILKGDYSLLLVKNGEAKVMAHTDTMAVTRDCYGWPKAFAEMFARDPQMRVYQCSLYDAYGLAAQIQRQLQPHAPRNPFYSQPTVFMVPIDVALPDHPAERRKKDED